MRAVARESFLDLKDDQQRVLTHLLDQAGDAILLLDLEGRYIEANARACELFGHPREKLLSMSTADTSLSEEAGILQGQSVRDYRCSLRRGDGTVVQVDASAGLIEIRGEKRILCFLRDATAQVEAERRYRAVIDSAVDAIVTADASGNIVRWNPAARAAFGYADDEVAGKPL